MLRGPRCLQQQQQQQQQRVPQCSGQRAPLQQPCRRRTRAAGGGQPWARSIAAQASAPLDAASTSQQQPAAADTRQASGGAASTSGSSAADGAGGVLTANASLLRRVLSTGSAGEALDLIIQQLDRQQAPHAVGAGDAELLLERGLEAGNTRLALSVYQQLCAAKRAQGRAGGAAGSSLSAWPAASLQHTQTLVLGLCRALQVGDAVAAIRGIRSQGLPGSDEVSFGHVVSSPLPPQRPLAVVQPQEGAKVVSDSNSRYEFELFSGTVASCSSEALQPDANPLASAARALGLLRRPPVAAVHELVINAPDGTSRAFRAGTATADVPGRPGERVTVVCAPSRGANRARRLLLSTSPPGRAPGEPMLVSNHASGAELPLLRPPPPGSAAGPPSWLLPAAVLLAGSDAASGLLDPALPLLITGSVVAAAGSAVASNALLLPRLKQLPAGSVKVEAIRQQLLAQHAGLDSKVKAEMQEACDDAVSLARLHQLSAKMTSVDAAGGGGAYDARRARLAAAAAGLEQRLAARLGLLEGYARVMAMIEIEVEMDLQVPIAELEGLGAELGKLAELESIREEWQAQAEAQDEVERLLRAPQ